MVIGLKEEDRGVKEESGGSKENLRGEAGPAGEEDMIITEILIAYDTSIIISLASAFVYKSHPLGLELSERHHPGRIRNYLYSLADQSHLADFTTCLCTVRLVGYCLFVCQVCGYVSRRHHP